MSEDFELRGLAALVHKAELVGTGRGGGSGLQPKGAVNVAHVILARAGKPLSVVEITTHAIGLGLWKSRAVNASGVMARSLLTNASDTEKGILEKTGPGEFGLRDGVGNPLPVVGAPTAEDTALYVKALELGLAEYLDVTDDEDEDEN